MTEVQAKEIQHGLRSALDRADECVGKAAARVQQSTMMLKGLVFKKLNGGKAPPPPMDVALED